MSNWPSTAASGPSPNSSSATTGCCEPSPGAGTRLYRITYNTCLDEMRRRPVVGLDGAYDPPTGEPGPADRVIVEMQVTELLQHLAEALRRRTRREPTVGRR